MKLEDQVFVVRKLATVDLAKVCIIPDATGHCINL